MRSAYNEGGAYAAAVLGLQKTAAGGSRIGRAVSAVGRGLKYMFTPQLDRLPQNAPPPPPTPTPPSPTPSGGMVSRFVKGLPRRAWDHKGSVAVGAGFGLLDGETPEQRMANAAWQGTLGMFGWPGVVAGMAIPRIAGGKKE